MTIYKNKPINTENLNRYSIKERFSKVNQDDFAKQYKKDSSFRDFIDSLPGFLAATDIRNVVKKIIEARKNNRAVIIGMGAHPIKVGLNPLLIQWMEKGILTALAVNGAAIIHDFELAYSGSTSEEVGTSIDDGSFGMAEETGVLLNRFIKDGFESGLGLGESIGSGFEKSGFQFNSNSLFFNAYRMKIPITVHAAIGTDIIHFHPEADGEAIGKGSLVDFKLFANCCAGLDKGGVFINLGSAVIIPEVFLKAVTVLRNLGINLESMTTLNMDFVNQYRPRVNVVQRPPKRGGGTGYNLVGHHEIMFPLLTAMVMEGLK